MTVPRWADMQCWDERSPGRRLLWGGICLVYLAYPIRDLVGGAPAGAAAIAAAAGVALFAVFVLRLLWILPQAGGERRTEAHLLLGGLAAVTVVLAIGLSESWPGLLFYLSALSALVLGVRAVAVAMALVAVAAFAVHAADGASAVDAALLAAQTLVVGLFVFGVRRMRALIAELEATRAQVAELAVSRERVRLARDLHDLLGHNLSVIALKSQLARRLVESDAAGAATEMHDVETVARRSLQETREAVGGLRSRSLAAELDGARTALQAAGIEASVRTDGPLPAPADALLAFAVREGVTNVIRHSRADRCDLTVRGRGNAAQLQVRDDGLGPARAGAGGSGLEGLQARMAEAGGTLEAGPAPGGGFQLTAVVPLSEPAREASRAMAAG